MIEKKIVDPIENSLIWSLHALNKVKDFSESKPTQKEGMSRASKNSYEEMSDSADTVSDEGAQWTEQLNHFGWCPSPEKRNEDPRS